jgi:hypothetical protein
VRIQHCSLEVVKTAKYTAEINIIKTRLLNKTLGVEKKHTKLPFFFFFLLFFFSFYLNRNEDMYFVFCNIFVTGVPEKFGLLSPGRARQRQS